MEYIQGLEGLYINDETAVTLGKFAGLHRGHQKLIRRTRECARQGLCAGIFGPFSGPGVGELFHSRVD